ncbi:MULTISPECIES: cell division protein FtsA [unclassified Exiguobacterium]|uniref:cell division protein FtsA n=1 Tax=unclassified Exiguobacterium TaxID=2644629 RepID=UPI001BE76C20|nr:MULTISPECIES: cell division protein FtsA [unclassified Exiguobacterium]
MEANGYVAALDIGTSEIKLVVGELLGGTLNILAEGCAPSAGVKRGAVVDIDKTVQAIKQAVEHAEAALGDQIRSVYVAIEGEHIQIAPCHGIASVKREDQEITDTDVIEVINSAQVMRLPDEMSVIDVIPSSFTVDQQTGVVDPRGMLGYRLEMHGKMVTGSKTILHSIRRSIERAGLKLEGFVLGNLALGMSAASVDEIDLGIGLIDIGHEKTTVSVFYRGDLVYSYILPVGSDHMTRDLVYKLNCKYQDAKVAKEEYGLALEEMADASEGFSFTNINGEVTFEPQAEISYVLEARIEEMFTLVLNRVQKVGVPTLSGGYLLCGGAAALPGIQELATRVMGQTTRLYQPSSIGVRHPKYATAVGVLKYVLMSDHHVSKSRLEKPEERVTVTKPDGTMPNDHDHDVDVERDDRETKNGFGRLMEKLFGV